MDNELQSILNDIQKAVELAIQKYKHNNQIMFIDLCIDELSDIINRIQSSEKQGSGEFLSTVQGMLDELKDMKKRHMEKVG